MNHFRSHTHAGGLITEVLAYQRASKTVLSIKAQILGQLEQAGEGGMTPDEFVDVNGGLINTIRRRFTDLWKDEKIKHHPQSLTRKNAAGNACTAWVLGVDLATQKKPLPSPYKPPVEAVMSEYIEGFDAGYGYALNEVEKYIRRNEYDPQRIAPLLTLLAHLKMEKTT